MLTDPAIATAADYADALIVTRRAKNALLLVVLLMILMELALFFVARYTTLINIETGNLKIASTALPATTASTPTIHWADFAQYATGLAIFLGLLFTVVLSMVLYLIVKIMLVGRLIGVARETSAFIWSIIVFLLLFPWQSFLASANFSDTSFKIPGVLWTWSELVVATNGAKFTGDFSAPSVLHWARFVAFPLLAVILLLVIQVKSNRGLRQALGEDVTSIDTVISPHGTDPLA
jgi:hypothetical protein